MTEICDHIFQTVLSVDKFDAVVRRTCRSGFRVKLEAADPTVVPPVRLFRVEFDAVDDRDRVRIAMRFVEKEVEEGMREAAVGKAAKPAAKVAEKSATPARPRLATA
ncbi:MAG: hypothetical protein ACYCZX_10465 [Rhodospirillaceae bacterium]